MGAVKRTHKQARQNQTAYKFAMRYPDKYAEILREVMLEVAPALLEVAKEVMEACKITLELRQEESHDERD